MTVLALSSFYWFMSFISCLSLSLCYLFNWSFWFLARFFQKFAVLHVDLLLALHENIICNYLYDLNFQAVLVFWSFHCLWHACLKCWCCVLHMHELVKRLYCRYEWKPEARHIENKEQKDRKQYTNFSNIDLNTDMTLMFSYCTFICNAFSEVKSRFNLVARHGVELIYLYTNKLINLELSRRLICNSW